MIESARVISLTSDEVAEVLTHCGDAALLVGGQALAFWASYYAVKPMGVLAAAVTSDVDFIGSAKVAASLGRSLGWHIGVSPPNDPTSQVARLTKTIPGIGIKQIDFVNAILGIQTSRAQKRAARVTFPNGARIRVLHPLDVLESRLRKILILPSNENSAAVAQARLAITIAARFLQSMVADKVAPATIHDAVERIADIALHRRLAKVSLENSLELLEAVPARTIPGEKFQSQRWPQILNAAAKLKKQSQQRAGR